MCAAAIKATAVTQSATSGQSSTSDSVHALLQIQPQLQGSSQHVTQERGNTYQDKASAKDSVQAQFGRNKHSVNKILTDWVSTLKAEIE